MNLEFLFFIIAVIFLSIPFIFYNKRRATKLQNKNPKIKNHIYISQVELPLKIEKLDFATNSNIVRKIFHTFEVLDIKSLNTKQLEKKEWHSWQISMLLNLYKNDKDFFIPNKEKVFHKNILNLDNKSLNSFIQTILLKYKANVDIKVSKNILSDDVIWTNKEISILFYILTTYKQ